MSADDAYDLPPISVTNLLLEVERLSSGQVNVGVSGDLSVKNLSPNKTIKVLYTLDDWKTERTHDANWQENYPESNSEKWKFALSIPFEEEPNIYSDVLSLDFLVLYQPQNHAECRDDNNGKNYRFKIKLPERTKDDEKGVRVLSYSWQVLKCSVMGVVTAPKEKDGDQLSILYTCDNWLSNSTLTPDLSFLGKKNDYKTFKIDLDGHKSFEFVARNQVDDSEVWENNGGRNYGFSMV